MFDYLIYLGAGIILILSASALYLHWRLYLLRKKTKQQHAEAEGQYLLAREHLNQSIQILCRALIDRQVGYAEASLRISKIMDQLAVPEDIRAEFIVFDKFAQAIDHIPILDAWKDLPKQQKKDFELQLNDQEALFADFIRDAAIKMIGKSL